MAFFDYSIDQFRQFVPGLTATFPLEDVRPVLTITEVSLLPAFLGDELTQQLIGISDWNPQQLADPAKSNQKRALYLCQVALARIGFAAYLPFSETQIGSDGITIPGSPDRKAAFEYQTKELKRSLVDSGWRAFDELIGIVAKNSDVFPGWSESSYYQEHEEALFKNAAEFSKFYPIQDRWLTFWALRPFMRAVEENRGETGQAQIDALPSSIDDAKRAKIKKSLLRAVAYQSVLDALPNLSVELNGANVQVNYASQFGNSTYYTPPGKDLLTWVMQNLQLQTDLAWSSFDAAITAANPAPATDADSDPGLVYGNGAITML